ncbi:MAG: CDP-alcohol phosphatidyltransferase family protein [Desulfurococcales archaeon]|nr:CDP-alcohol phosphatidyltransferase family protein [Desulfurococcales archaeon]
MTLERLRGKVAPVTEKVGEVLARISPNPNTYTLLGLALAWLAPLASMRGLHWAGILLVAASALVDALDGAVARAAGKVSRRGEFLDSVTDRLSDTAYYTALSYAGLAPPLLLVALGFSVSISYTRAKGELVGVSMRGVGIMERGDRVVWILLVYALAAAGMVYYGNLLLGVGVLLLAYTLVVRVARVWKAIREEV